MLIYLFVVNLQVRRGESISGVRVLVHEVEEIVERARNEALQFRLGKRVLVLRKKIIEQTFCRDFDVVRKLVSTFYLN